MAPPKSTLNSRDHNRLASESQVFSAFMAGEKVSVAELTERVNEKIREGNTGNPAYPPKLLSERTVRRAVNSLIKNGYVIEAGKKHNAQLFSLTSSGAFSDDLDEKIVPFGESLMPIDKFMMLIAGEDSEPLKYKLNDVLTDKIQYEIRRRMAFAVMTAGNAGYAEKTKKTRNDLVMILQEIEFLHDVLNSFVHSPIWYDQYRDRMAPKLRKFEQQDPELFQLAFDFVKGG